MNINIEQSTKSINILNNNIRCQMQEFSKRIEDDKEIELLDEESMDLLMQEHKEGDWDGVNLEDHEYFLTDVEHEEVIETAPSEHVAEQPPEVKAPTSLKRPYFPPGMSVLQKTKYLFENHARAFERYKPFANQKVLLPSSVISEIPMCGEDLYRFHAKGTHVRTAAIFKTYTLVDYIPRFLIMRSKFQNVYCFINHFQKKFYGFRWDDELKKLWRLTNNYLLRYFESKW
uniref:Uncharacterized protein n=1 Tax=Heterorhabditis bacteriophora TaxID=37862 RepID=A0A1I7XCF7_HETBA